MLLLFLLLLVLWPLAELFVFVQVADAIGLLYALLLLIAAWPLGIWALRSQGSAAWRRFAAAAAENRAPTKEVVDGLMVGAVQFTSRSRRPSDVDSTAHDIRPPPLQR